MAEGVAHCSQPATGASRSELSGKIRGFPCSFRAHHVQDEKSVVLFVGPIHGHWKLLRATDFVLSSIVCFESQVAGMFLSTFCRGQLQPFK